MAGPELLIRLDRVEAELQALEGEVAEVRRLAVRASEMVTAAEAMRLAWAALERGRRAEAVEQASTALRLASQTGDQRVLGEVRSFAGVVPPEFGIRLQAQIDELVPTPAKPVEPAPAVPPPKRLPFPAQPPAQAPVAPAARVAPVAPVARAVPAAPVRHSGGERLMAFATSELSGARGFALAGGIVTLLGIVFLFVLAANRGWIGPVARVSIGAAASLAVLLGGVALRARYGRLQAALAAVGTGIAGGFATLAAATIVYAFLPDWGALLVAAAIAATGGVLAWSWNSQILAGLSLVGAAAAPGLVALDDGITAAGTAFAVVVLGVALVAGAVRRWFWLSAAVGGVALAQLAWLTGAASSGDAGAIAVAAAAAIALLGGSVAWQESAPSEALDPFGGSLALLSGGVALSTLLTLLPDNVDAGVALAVAAVAYAAAGYLVARRRRDLGWVIGAVALLLAGVSTSLLLSERSLTVAWAVEASALALLAWRLRSPRFELASITYLAIGVAHLFTVDIWIAKPTADLAGRTAPGMYALAGAALVAGTLAIDCRRDRRSTGLPAGLEPLWDGIVAARGTLRFCLYGAAVLLAAGATAALLSGTWLTLAWLAAAAVLGVGAWWLGERRLQGAALTLFAIAGIHALLVEAQPRTLWLARGLDPLRPVPSLAALAAASVLLAALAVYEDRGIAFLGPLTGAERRLAWLEEYASALRVVLLTAAAWFAVWAAGLVLVDLAYGPGQAAATGLWAAAAAVTAAVAARRRSPLLALASVAPAAFAFGKAATFDWHELAAAPSATSLLLAAGGVLLVGFLARYAAAAVEFPLELGSLATAAIAVLSALIAIHRVAPDRPALGAAALAVSVVVVGFAVPPFRAWHSGAPEKWLRDLASVYWAVGLLTLAFGEWELVSGSQGAAVALWGVSAALVATAAQPLRETRLWAAGAVGAASTTLVCLEFVTVPSHLVNASAHPGAGLWALAVCIVALAWIARIAPEQYQRARSPLALVAAGLGVFGLSLGVLEIAERVSTASIATDFQRGHTGVSALWALLALGVFVFGLLRSERIMQRAGLALFGVALAKLFLYDLRSLSSITRALSFLAVGALLLAAAFFVERIIHHGGGPGGHAGARAV